MLPYLRWSLFAAGVLFFSLIGFTAENFVIEVARRLVPIDPQNLIAFNALHIAATLLPILAIGLLLHAAIGNDQGFGPRLWVVVFGIVLGVAGFRVDQLVKVLNAASQIPAIVPPSRYQVYFFDFFAPYIYLGVLTYLPSILLKSHLKISINTVFSSVTLAFLWIMGSGKSPVTHSAMAVFVGYLIALLSAIAAHFAAKKAGLVL